MSEDWPAWATERVRIEEHDPAWAALAARLIGDLEARLASWLEAPIEHVGSTAVPGLPAKPIVDLMGPVTSLRSIPDADPVLADAGWELVPPELDGRPWRRFYVLPDRDRRLAHLHLVAQSDGKWRDVLAFRETLKNRPDLAASYAEVKRSAAASHPNDREAYTAAKSAFVDRVTRHAR